MCSQLWPIVLLEEFTATVTKLSEGLSCGVRQEADVEFVAHGVHIYVDKVYTTLHNIIVGNVGEVLDTSVGNV